MKGEWFKEWWRHFGVGYVHFEYIAGGIDTSWHLLLGFLASEPRDVMEALIDGISTDPQIGLM
eukprot:1531659-Rhodomonas_salina.1